VGAQNGSLQGPRGSSGPRQRGEMFRGEDLNLQRSGSVQNNGSKVNMFGGKTIQEKGREASEREGFFRLTLL